MYRANWTPLKTSRFGGGFDSLDALICAEAIDAGQADFWDIDERYAWLSEAWDPLEKLNAVFHGRYSASHWPRL
jgi:hypothetical protein